MIMTMNRPTAQHRASQEGFVAIFATIMIMGIVTLLVVGFSYATRQAQRRALDDQLNTQAFYAAESGVNDAIRALEADPELSKTDCGPDMTFDNYDVDTELGISYTCLLIDSSLPSIRYDNVPVVSTDGPIVTDITLPAGGANSVRFYWDSRDTAHGPAPNNYTANQSFLTAAEWGGQQIGMLRIDLVPIGSLDKTAMANGTYTFYAYPNPGTSGGTASTSISSGPAGQGAVVAVPCNNTGGFRCGGSVTLTGAGANQTAYAVRLQSYYNTVRAELEFMNSNDGTGPPLEIAGGQAVIDSTGQAAGVFRRIQVRVPLNAQVGRREASALVSADSLCKRIVGIPNDSRISMPSGIPPGGPSCPMPTGTSGVGTGNDGDAAHASPCTVNDCTGQTPSPCYTGADISQCYVHRFQNISSNDPSVVASCVWDWGDGTQGNNIACNRGDTIDHRFPQLACRRSYNVVLTIQFNNGMPPRSYSENKWVPWLANGPGWNPVC